MIRVFKHYFPYNVLLLAIADLMLLVLSGEVAWRLRIAQIGSGSGPFIGRLPELASFALVIWTAMIAVGAYGAEALRSVRFGTARILVAVSFGVLGISLINLVIPGAALWRSVLLYAMVLSVAFLVANRLLAIKTLGLESFRRRILVLGAGQRAARLMNLSRQRGSGFTVVSFIDLGDCDPVIDGSIPRAAIIDLGHYVVQMGAGEVVLALQERRNALPLKDLLRIKTKGVYINDFSSFLERETGRVDLDTLNPSWLIFSDGFSAGRRISAFAKRIFDIVTSLLILTIGLPLILIFGVAIKLDSKGPIFFRQTRVGLYGQNFELVKLRSMHVDAEPPQAKWAEEDDPRITRIGRIIRKVRIDELPQLWSVLRGHMSFVGPRPEVPAFVEELERELPYYAERHEVKPGITGWAQINYPYGASVEDSRHKLEFDLYYAKNYTPFLDLLILLQTARVILWPDGAR